MDEFVQAHRKIVLDTTLESLKKNGFEAVAFASREEAAKFIIDLAADCKSVGIAGTHTVRALGVIPEFEQSGKTVYDHWKLKLGTPEEVQCRKDQSTRGHVSLFRERADHDRADSKQGRLRESYQCHDIRPWQGRARCGKK